MSAAGFLGKLLDGAEVAWVLLGDLEDAGIVKLGRGNVISKTDLDQTPGGYPVYSSSASKNGEFGRYGKFMFDDERITWSIDGGGRFFYRHPHKYSVTNVCGWLRISEETKLSTRYLYHFLSSAWSNKVFDYIKKAHPSVIRKEYLIPIPCPDDPEKSLAIQGEIVRILDSFTELTAELTAELSARKKQYNHYRDRLLTFEGGDVEWKPLDEIGEFIRGKRFTKADYVEDGIDVIHYGEIYTRFGVYASNTFSQVNRAMASSLRYAEPNDVILTDVGETVDEVGKAMAWVGTNKVAIHDHCYAFRHRMNPKFIAYCMQTSEFIAKKYRYVAQTKVNTLLIKPFGKAEIPVPFPNDPAKSLAEQARIATILDKFDTLTTSLTEGLPREIELREKQYTYYRDQLLNFPKPDAEAA